MHLSLLLEHEGYRVADASNGTEALKYLRSGGPVHRARARRGPKAPAKPIELRYAAPRVPMLETVVSWRRNDTSPFVEEFVKIARKVMARE